MPLDDDHNDQLDKIPMNSAIEGLVNDDKNDGAVELKVQQKTAPNNDESDSKEKSQVVQSDRPVLTGKMLEKKVEFERQRDEILDDVPQSAKDRFGSIYFSRFGGYIGPVLVVNPYRVAPGPVRNTWLEMFHKVRSSGRLKYITHLAYWYGHSAALQSAYSLVRSADLNDYKSGLKLVEKRLADIKKKEDSGKILTKQDAALLRGMEEMEKDIKKDLLDRHGYVPDDFLEDYEYSSEDEMSVEENESEDQPQSARLKGRKKKAGKKTKKDDDEDEPHGASTSGKPNGETFVSKKVLTKTPKKGKKRETTVDPLKEPRPKKKSKALDYDEVDDSSRTPMTADGEVAVHATESQSHDQSLDKETNVAGGDKNAEDSEAVRVSAYDEALAAIGDVSSHDEADDDFEGSVASADEEAFDGNEEEGSKRKAQKLTSKKGPNNPSKERAKKKATKAKTKIEKRPKGEKKTASNEGLKKAEQRSFELCEMKYLNLIRQWRNAISNKDGDQIKRIYVQLLENMASFTAPFMEVYEMAQLMKQSKAIVNDGKRKEVMAAFQETYPRKLAKVPEGFKPFMESEKGNLERGNQPNEELRQKNSKSTIQIPVQTKSTIPSDDRNPAARKTLLDDSISDNKTESNEYGSVELSKSALNDQSEVSKGRIQLPSNKGKVENTTTSRSDVPSQEKELQQKELRQQQQQKSIPFRADRKKFSLGTLMRPSASVQASANNTSSNHSSSLSRRDTSSGSLSKLNNKDDQVVVAPAWTEMLLVNKDYPTDRNRALALEFLDQAAAFIPGGDSNKNMNINHDAIIRNLEGAVFEWAKSTAAATLIATRNRLAVKKQQQKQRQPPNGRTMMGSTKDEGSYQSSKMMDEKGINGATNNNNTSEKGGLDEDDAKQRESQSGVDYDDEGWVDVYWDKIHDLTACLCGNEKKEGTIATLISEGKFKTANELVGLSDEELWKSFQSEPLTRFSMVGRL